MNLADAPFKAVLSCLKGSVEDGERTAQRSRGRGEEEMAASSGTAALSVATVSIAALWLIVIRVLIVVCGRARVESSGAHKTVSRRLFM